jgi:hypothetical protein
MARLWPVDDCRVWRRSDDLELLRRLPPHQVAVVLVEGHEVGHDEQAGERAEPEGDAGEPRGVEVPEDQDQARGDRHQHRAEQARHDDGLAAAADARGESSPGRGADGRGEEEHGDEGFAIGTEHRNSLVGAGNARTTILEH